MTDEFLALEQPYEIVSVRRAKPPPGTEGSNWHCYVIAFEGASTIRGCRQGSLKAVTGAVEEIVAQLNERHLGNRGRVNLVWSPKKKTTSSDMAFVSFVSVSSEGMDRCVLSRNALYAQNLRMPVFSV